jgi:hypothetical protein
MGFLVLQEFYFLFTLFTFYFLTLNVPFVDGVDLRFQFYYFVVEFCALCFQVNNSLFQVCLAVLCLQLFAHCEGHTGLVQGLVGCNGHFNLVTDSKQKQASFWL